MIPRNIDWNHILEAIGEIDAEGIPKSRESSKFILLHEGKHYPPKYVVSLASRYASGTELDSSKFGGGQETNLFLKKLGFKVVEITSVRAKRFLTPQKKDKMKKRRHDERCPKCKNTVKAMLKKIYGEVKVNHRVETGTKPEDYKGTRFYSELERIFSELQKHRGHNDFVKSPNLSHCDFFVPNPGFIVEFDESQHFSVCRKISLTKYPPNLELGFKPEKWIKLCQKLNKKDNDPPYRDEQRAWYDTLRDFIPAVKGLKPTIRLFSRDYTWCSLDPNVPSHVERFKLILEGEKQEWTIEVREDPDPSLARIILARNWCGHINVARKLLEDICEKWPKGKKVKFLVTCGGFITFNWPNSLTRSNVGTNRNPNKKAVELLAEEARIKVESLLSGPLRQRLGKFSRYITVGVDTRKSKISLARNYIGNLHAELVFLIDLESGQCHWTGKSYPTPNQEKGLVWIKNLHTHFFDSQFGKVMILGCHDLTIFNPRSDATAKRWRKRLKKDFKKISRTEEPGIVLQHPHTTDSVGTWTASWNRLRKSLPTVKEHVSAGRYFNEGNHCRSELNDVLLKTKSGDTIDFIIWPEKMN